VSRISRYNYGLLFVTELYLFATFEERSFMHIRHLIVHMQPEVDKLISYACGSNIVVRSTIFVRMCLDQSHRLGSGLNAPNGTVFFQLLFIVV